ncbi:MAG: cholesterol oxidase [Myxococcota bacterium]|jgi:cholesterol oxidase
MKSTKYDPEVMDLQTKDGVALQLRRYKKEEVPSDMPPVLLLHGASAASLTFEIGAEQPLVDYLIERGRDVWALDWRASNRYDFTDSPTGHRLDFTLDQVSDYDIPAALTAMRDTTKKQTVDVLAHCLGGAAMAQAVARRTVTNLGSVILSAMGLFYTVPVAGMLKALDGVLERLLENGGWRLAPNDWTQVPLVEDLYKAFPTFAKPHPAARMDPLHRLKGLKLSRGPRQYLSPDEYCNRLAFMFGECYLCKPIGDIHRQTAEQFGYMYVPMYLHGTQNIRRGHAARFSPPGDTKQPESYLQPAPFAALPRLTLLTGNENRLWHRDSIDNMYEWLLNSGVGRPGSDASQVCDLEKHVLLGFGHQDLLWGDTSKELVFPLIEGRLTPGGG